MNYVDAMLAKDFVALKNAEGVTVYADIMSQAGYIFVPCPGSWNDVHQWLTYRYGEKNYVWTGEKFWFNTNEEAEEFKRAFR